MPREISVLKKKLTNLSSANPLLWQSRLRAGIHLDLTDLLFETVVSSADFLDGLCSGKKKIRLAPVYNPRNPSENRMGAALQRLSRHRLTENQERGTDQLFLAWPFLSGRWPDGSPVRTPFQLIPLNLFSDGSIWWMEPRTAEARINPAFLLAFTRHCGKPLDENLFEKELGLEAADARSYLTSLYGRLENSPLDVHFNSGLFTLELEKFRPQKKEEVSAVYQPGMLRLQPHAIIGLFPLSDSLLLPDYDEFERKGLSLEDFFLYHSVQPAAVTERDLLFPLPADGSQEACLKEILSGKNLLIEGPPGSGKSQLITNLAAAAAGSGKSVLLVCQKKVALEVVLDRLKQLGIGRHVAMWADFRNDVSGLYGALAQQIEALDETLQRNKSLDTVVLEREYNRLCQEIARISALLEDWKSACFDESLAGVSWFELQSRYPQMGEGQSVDSVFLKFKREDWEEFLLWMNQHSHELDRSSPEGSLLRFRAHWPPEEIRGIISSFSEMLQAEEEFRNLAGRFGQSLSSKQFAEAGQRAAGFPVVFPELREHPVEVVLSENFALELEEMVLQLQELCRMLEGWPEFASFSESDFAMVMSVYYKNQGVNSVKLLLGSLFSSDIRRLRNWFSALRQAGFQNPGLALEAASALAAIGEKHPVFRGISVFRKGLIEIKKRIAAIPHLLEQLAAQREFYQKYLQLQPLHPAVSMQSLEEEAKEMAFLTGRRNQHLSRLQELFPGKDPEELLPLLRGDLTAIEALSELIFYAESLREKVPPHWQEALHFFRLAGIRPESPETNRLWAEGWLKELEKRRPVLRLPATWFEQQIQILQQSLLRKQELALGILQLNLEEATHKNLERNRLQNRVTYRNLYHQVSKKRQRLPLRTLWKSFGDEILRLIPCWLATPESVSATWSPDMKFDLVIFDEASQCFSEKGIPSVARGRQIVVLGDGKQLPPNQLFSSRWEEEVQDPEEALFSEQDSLLDLARQFFPSRMLTGHYRSEFPELIDFSNRNFYDGKLRVIPSPHTLIPRSPSLRFVKLEGSWENRCNRAEAEWIAEHALRFFREEKEHTLGVICFNISQQERVEEEVLSRSIRESTPIPDWFFVKNIENVQGDERDFIWFSLGYARNAAGNILSWFGSLSQEGGENRLNVAITRARTGITLISSLHPQEWNFARRLSRGPALLAAYVDFVSRVASQEAVESQLAEGSLPGFCDEIRNSSGEYTLVFNSIPRLYTMDSMKAHFGLNPNYYRRLGYRISFEYWSSIRQDLKPPG